MSVMFCPQLQHFPTRSKQRKVSFLLLEIVTLFMSDSNKKVQVRKLQTSLFTNTITVERMSKSQLRNTAATLLPPFRPFYCLHHLYFSWNSDLINLNLVLQQRHNMVPFRKSNKTQCKARQVTKGMTKCWDS